MQGQYVNIFLGNHPYVAQETLRDMCMAFSGTLTKLGHKVGLSADLMPPPAVNLLFEHFQDDVAALIAPLLPQIRVGLICTEPFSGNPMSDPNYREMRIRNMLRIGAGCQFVWCLDPASLELYRDAFRRPRVFPFPVGYIETLADLAPVPDAEKIWDVCFTGSMTHYRASILGELKATGLKVVHGLFPHFLRQSIMARSRLHLTLKQSEDLSLPSQVRMSYCLSNDLVVVSDLGARAPESGIESYVMALARSELPGWCREFIAGRVDRGALRTRIAAFKTEYRMDRLNADTVAASLAA